jgi:predicted ATPase
MLAETRTLAGERGAYRLQGGIEGLRIPATVQAVIASRIDRLPSDDKQLLQTASAVGKDVLYALLQSVAELTEDALRQGLTHLQAGEFLYGR